MEEEIKDPAVETGEGTPSESAPETKPAEGTEESVADTSVQPGSEATAEAPTRAQERIQKLAAERTYWKDLAQANAPDKKSEAEDGEITVDAIADTVVQKLSRQQAEARAEEAKTAMLRDAAEAEAKYPELSKNQELADDVIVFAQARGISIQAAAERLIGTGQTKEVKSQAEIQAKSGAATPTGSRAASGASSPVDVSRMSESEKAANWGQVVESYSQE